MFLGEMELALLLKVTLKTRAGVALMAKPYCTRKKGGPVYFPTVGQYVKQAQEVPTDSP